MTPSTRAACAIVAPPADPLADAVAHRLGRARPLLRLDPTTLAAVPVRLTASSIRIHVTEIDAVLWRARSIVGFADDFALEDRPFCDGETRAVWLAALALPGVRATFSPPADAWFQGAHWPTWRHRLALAGIPTVAIRYGAAAPGEVWLPYAGSRTMAVGAAAVALGAALIPVGPTRALYLAGRRLLDAAGERVPDHGVGRALRAAGLALAGIQVDAQGAVVTVDPVPQVEADLAARLAEALLEVWP